ncbi:MAG: ABC transporter permease [Chloroflexota bacterium]
MSEMAAPSNKNTPDVWHSLWRAVRMPLLALGVAFLIGGIVIWVTSGSLVTVFEAYWGLLRGAFFKQRGFSESLVASIPYVFLSLGLAISFKSGLFNIGVEGQFYIGAVSAAWAGQLTSDLPAIVHLPLTLGAGMLGGAVWAGIPGILKVKTGAHEVISTMMMNYIAFRLTEYLILGPLRDANSTAVQTPRVSPHAELWTLAAIPQRLQDPLNALALAVFVALLAAMLLRAWVGRPALKARFPSAVRRRAIYLGGGAAIGLLVFILLPLLARAWWPFQDQYDRLHVGLILAFVAAALVWWLLQKTTIGFELRTVGANPSAAHYAGIDTTRSVVLAMALSGALAGLAGTIEVLGVSICRCLPLFFSSGYGFDSIAITLLAKNNPFGILLSSFLFGAMRNGADLMELTSGVSKYIISLIQALALLFVAAPGIVRWMFRMKKVETTADAEAPLTRGWGG